MIVDRLALIRQIKSKMQDAIISAPFFVVIHTNFCAIESAGSELLLWVIIAILLKLWLWRHYIRVL